MTFSTSGLSLLLHGVISFPDAMSYDKWMENCSALLKESLCYLVPMKQFCLDHGSQSKVLKSDSFGWHRQNVSQNIFQHDITFSLWQNRS